MSAADNLRAARALIEDPKRWTQGWYGRSANGLPVDRESLNKEAVCFCSLGALMVAANTTGLYPAGVRELERVVGCVTPTFNDARKRTHAWTLSTKPLSLRRLHSEPQPLRVRRVRHSLYLVLQNAPVLLADLPVGPPWTRRKAW
jgi:hypothetical protein